MTAGSFKERIAAFAARASLEITAADGALPQALAGRLPPGTTLYVAHTPNTKVADVAEVACAAERAGFRGCPHLVARRIASRKELDSALARLKAAAEIDLERARRMWKEDMASPFKKFGDVARDADFRGALGWAND